jgi:membrane protease YdiL (CAAX protease family)
VIGVLMVAGAAAVFLGWLLVASGRISIWVAFGPLMATLGVLALVSGRVAWCPRFSAVASASGGAVAGMLLYLATTAFVLIVRRWPGFDRHVASIYDQRRGLSLPAALLVAALVVAPGEELFWRGLFQSRSVELFGSLGGAVVAWAVYVAANGASQNLPIIAGAVVAGAVWSALTFWTHGILASLLCHVVWTALMVSVPPGGARARARASA